MLAFPFAVFLPDIFMRIIIRCFANKDFTRRLHSICEMRPLKQIDNARGQFGKRRMKCTIFAKLTDSAAMLWK